MRKHGGTPSRRDKHVTLAAISPPSVARGRFVGGQQSGLAGCKPPPLFTCGAPSCSCQGRRQGEPWGASPRPSAPTLPWHNFQVCCATPPWSHLEKMVTKAVLDRAQAVVICPDGAKPGKLLHGDHFWTAGLRFVYLFQMYPSISQMGRPAHYQPHAGEALHLSSMEMIVTFGLDELNP